MKASIATATFYYLPFEDTLDIIKAAGFERIELDFHWQGGDNWNMAQHLMHLSMKDTLSLIADAGLEIASIHDGGGVVSNDNDSVIAPQLREFMHHSQTPPEYMVFHVPHMKTNNGPDWWKTFGPRYISDLNDYSEYCAVTIENLPEFDGYYTPLASPADLFKFVGDNGFYANIDTSHYAQTKVDICQAAETLGPLVNGVHLSDFLDGKAHVAIGEGSLDLKGFLKVIKNIERDNLDSGGQSIAITLECTIDDSHEMPRDDVVRRLTGVREYLRRIMA